MATRKELLDIAKSVVKVDLNNPAEAGESILKMVAVLEGGVKNPEKYQLKVQTPHGILRILADSKDSIKWVASQVEPNDPGAVESAMRDLESF